MSGSVIVKIELPLDLYGKLARATNSEVGRLLRTLASRAARMESEELKSIAQPAPHTPQQEERIFSGRQTHRSIQRVQYIERELNKGTRVADIAIALGISEGAVYGHMKREGLTPPKHSEQAQRTRAEREAAIQELWLLHHSTAEISRRLQIPNATVHRVVARLDQEDKIA